ncbi:PHP domain-containing protein, partial [Candidatus Microgenomates bacterium]|nr:PHP domain-containing protein [Candidatus Microgenomates bacterium]
LKAARGGKIATIESFGSKSEQDIIDSLERFKKGQVKSNRMSLPVAYNQAMEVIEYLKKHQRVIEAIPLGSLRRFVSTIGDIDVAVSTYEPEEAISWFLKYPKKASIVEKGPSGATILLDNGRQIDLRVQSPDKFGAMLQYFTGSKNHNIHLRELALKQGLSLSEYGIKLIKKIQITNTKSNSKFKIQNSKFNKKLNLYQFPNEKDFYNALGLSWIPPELRENTGEIEAALQEGLPKLVELEDIKGDFHIHSNYDLEPSHDLGRSSLEEILRTAAILGYEYIGISDHNPSQSKHTSEQIADILKKRRQYFEQIMSSTKSVRVKLFIMLEVDILPDGQLPIPENAFESLDAVIVSIHSCFQMPKKEMTDRIIFGLSHPKAKIFGHPTGRLIGKREGYEIDWQRLFNFCKEKDKAIEINSYPDRLDLPDIMVREAIKNKIKLAIDTDSHEAEQMKMMTFGVSVAKRGWAEKGDIINTMPYNKVKEWLLKY